MLRRAMEVEGVYEVREREKGSNLEGDDNQMPESGVSGRMHQYISL